MNLEWFHEKYDKNQSVMFTVVLTELMGDYGVTVALIPSNQWKIPLSLPEDFDPGHAGR